MINFEWYRTFKAVYQTGSLTAAAKTLFISQPNVSQHISALEAHVGKTLFERKPKITPTDYGKIIYAQIIEPIEKLEAVEMLFKKTCMSKTLPTLNLGVTHEFSHLLDAEHLQDFPAFLISSFGETKDLVQSLLKEELDFVITPKNGNNLKLSFEPIFSEKLMMVVSPNMDTSIFDNLIAGERFIESERWLVDQHWFSYSSDLMGIRKFWLNNFKKRPGVVPKFIIPDFHTILRGVAKGNGIAIVSEIVAREMVDDGKIKELWGGITSTTNDLFLAYDPIRAAPKFVNMMKQVIPYQITGPDLSRFEIA
jgi:DNA-binding transcriptional LysR family regulator